MKACTSSETGQRIPVLVSNSTVAELSGGNFCALLQSNPTVCNSQYDRRTDPNGASSHFRAFPHYSCLQKRASRSPVGTSQSARYWTKSLTPNFSKHGVRMLLIHVVTRVSRRWKNALNQTNASKSVLDFLKPGETARPRAATVLAARLRRSFLIPGSCSVKKAVRPPMRVLS